MEKLLIRLFGMPEEINGGNRCPTYLYRWHLFSNRWFKLYIHHFVADDWSRDLHDHPKRFLSIGLKGSYIEETPDDAYSNQFKVYKAPWIRSFPAEHIHRILVPSKSCWTMVAVFQATREWGFWRDGQFIPWKEYVFGKSKHLADQATSCND